MKKIAVIFASVFCMFTMGLYSHAGAGQWNGGIGTGLFRLNIEGDVGINTNLAGFVKFKDIDLNPNDISDLMASAFGFGGYFTDGKWMIDYSVAYLKLEDETSQGSVAFAKFEYEATGFEVLVGYPIYSTPSILVRANAGVRYTKHDISWNLRVGDERASKSDDYEWFDGLIGLSADVTLAKNWSWNSRITAGYGGSDGTYSGQTGIAWRFHKHWSTTLYGKYTAVEFEEGSKGDSDWYLYDVDEFGLGLNILFHW